MISMSSKVKKGFISLTLGLCLVLALASPVWAGLRVSGGKIEDSLAPGSETSYTMNVANTSPNPMDVAVEVKGYGASTASSYAILEPEEDTSPYSARELLTVAPQSFHLEPKESQDITVTATIPSNVGSGGRYAIIYIHTMPSPGGTVAVATAIAARVLLTIEGSELIKSGEVSQIELSKAESGQPLEIRVIVENDGNCHYKISAQGEIKDGADKVVAISSPVTPGFPIVPACSQEITVPFLDWETLPAGRYQVEIEVVSEDGTPIDAGTASFELSGTGELLEPPVETPPEELPTETEGYPGKMLIILGGLLIAGLIILIFFVIRRVRRG